MSDEHADQCLRAMRRHRGPITLRELRAVCGLTDREGDRAMAILRRRGLATFDRAVGGWLATQRQSKARDE